MRELQAAAGRQDLRGLADPAARTRLARRPARRAGRCAAPAPAAAPAAARAPAAGAAPAACRPRTGRAGCGTGFRNDRGTARRSPSSTAFAVEMGARPAVELPRPPGRQHGPCVADRAAQRARTGRRPAAGARQRPQGPHRAGRRARLRQGGAAGRARPRAGRRAAGGGGLGVLPWPQVDFAKFGPVERVEMSRIRKLSGPNLHRNWVTIPHVTNHDDADITALEELRVQLNRENEKSGVKITMLAFLIKACVAALQRFPDFNSSIDRGQRRRRLPQEVLPHRLRGRHAQRPGRAGGARCRPQGRAGAGARDRGAGGQGARGQAGARPRCRAAPSRSRRSAASAAPTSRRSSTRPRWRSSASAARRCGPPGTATQFVPRLILPLSLSWDHRVVDGAGAARFTAYLAQVLADLRRVLV